MQRLQERSIQTVARLPATALAAFLLLSTLSCDVRVQPDSRSAETTVRVGVSNIDVSALIQNLTVESLGRVGDDGRMEPRLAESWDLSDDGLVLTIRLRPKLTFHDGSPVTAALVAETLKKGVLDTMGPAAEDVSDVTAIDDSQVEIRLSRRSPFAVEALEAVIRKPNEPTIGTGPFRTISSSSVEMAANPDYYRGPSTIDRVVLATYPTARTAWAELLRNRLDMIYEVGADAIDSLESSTTVTLYPFNKRYQFVLLFNTDTPALRSAAVRRALNTAVDRAAFIAEALEGRGLASSGPIWPRHWAAQNIPAIEFAPETAAKTIAAASGRIRFHCLVPTGTERLALVIQRQLEAVGVEMILEERSVADASRDVRDGHFESFITPIISGPSILRPYVWWQSQSSKNVGNYSNPAVDAALDAIRHARSDEDYRQGVKALQQHIVDDPPAVFLAWEVTARAVSKRFVVPAQPGLDIMGTLRLWRPAEEDGPTAVH